MLTSIRAPLFLTLLIAAVFLFHGGARLAAQQPNSGSAPTPSSVAASAITQGLAALQTNQPRQALTNFQQALQADPNNASANLLASTAAVELYQGALAVQYAEKARQLDPQNWKIHTTLVAAYSAAGMRTQRDEERATLRQL
ncbi:MAG: hypothetical protein WCB76_05895, partial [Acidobacteriaceae bacterium]